MELFFLSLSAFLTIAALALALGIFTSKKSSATKTKLPPGSFGWPIFGETIEFLYGKPEKFVGERMKKYSPHVFKTKILGEKTAVICGPAGNKFLFANEQKLVVAWRPHPMQKLYRSYKNLLLLHPLLLLPHEGMRWNVAFSGISQTTASHKLHGKNGLHHAAAPEDV